MWFRKSKEPTAFDVVWLTKAARLRGIQKALQQAISKGVNCLAFAHFQDTFTDMQDTLKASSIDYELLESLLVPISILSRIAERPKPRIYLALSEGLSATYAEAAVQTPPLPLEIIVTERYPLEDRDHLILSFARACGITQEIHFHSSLDDPLLRRFSGGRTADFIRRLLPDEDAPIQHATITSSIRSAQQKIRKEAMGDARVGSAEDWFKYNLPGQEQAQPFDE